MDSAPRPNNLRRIYTALMITWFLPTLIGCYQADGENRIDPDLESEYDSPEKNLLDNLFRRYRKVGLNARPIRNLSEATVVVFGLGMIQMELDERENILTLSMWTRYRWRDEFLVWSPGDYENITSIRLWKEQLWTPDIMLYNTADVDRESRAARVIVQSDGTVSWYPHCVYRSACAVDVKNYPFDIQACHLWFGSWTYNSKEVDLQMAFPGGMDLTTFQQDYKNSSKWEVVNVTSLRRVLPNEDEDPNFVVLTFTLVMRRRMVFSTYMLTLPCVFLACLTLAVFWIPPERPDRTTLAMNSFGSFLVLLLILVEAAMPAASCVPTLGVYYCCNLVIIMMSVIISAFIINVSKGKEDQPPPRWLYFLTIHVLAKFVCFGDRPKPLQRLEEESRRKSSYVMVSQLDESRPCANLKHCLSNCDCIEIRDLEQEDCESTKLSFSDAGNNYPGIFDLQAFAALENSVQGVRSVMQKMCCTLDERLALHDRQQLYELQWRSVAHVLDRLFFFIYVILIGVSIAVFFPRPPGEDEYLYNVQN